MKKYGHYLIIWLGAALSIHLHAGELKTVDHLKLESYMGKWHQVAAIPAWFQRQCHKNTTAFYEKIDSRTIKVINQCEKKDGTNSSAEGRARIHDQYEVASKLQVTFAQIFQKWWWTIAGDYWVIELADDYSYSVVGDPDHKYLWILSREPSLDHETLQFLEEKISSHGYDTCKIKITQEGSLNETKLCQWDFTKSLVSN